MNELKPCPFCGGENIKMMHKDIGFIGWNGFGAKKIKYQSYAMCNKCYSKGAPATCEYEVDTERGRAVLEENDQKAATAWNRRAEDTEAKRRRAEENPQPLTLDELREMGGKPYWHQSLTGDVEATSKWMILPENIAKYADNYDYGINWLAYRTRPEEEQK